MTSKWQIEVESEDEMRRRGLESPARIDALAYAFAHVDMPVADVGSHAGHTSPET